MNINLISTGQVPKQIPYLRFILEAGVFIIQDKTGRNADIVYENVQYLCEITDLKWLRASDDSEDTISNLAYNNIKMKRSYIESVIHEVYCAEMAKVKRDAQRRLHRRVRECITRGEHNQGRGLGLHSSPTRTSTISTD